MASHIKWCKVFQQVKEVAKMSDCDEDLLRFVMALALKRPLHNNEGGGILKDGVIHSTIQVLRPFSFQSCVCSTMRYNLVSCPGILQ
jgi:hypothetical protein